MTTLKNIKGFQTDKGVTLTNVILMADSLRDELEDVEISIQVTPRGSLKAEFKYDASWITGRTELLKESVAYLTSSPP